MNTQVKHTPGPWYAANMGNDYQGLVIDEKTGANIAVTYDKRHAPFVAAAPAMYEALQATLAYFMRSKQSHAPEVRAIRAALAQAEGRTL